jgi:hypothetical protein
MAPLPTATAAPHQVLIIGELSAPEMSSVRDWLARRIGPSGPRLAVDLRAVRRLRDAEGWIPDLIIVCQTWPDQFSGVDIHALLTWFPLTRLVCVYGVWCDSDGRSRTDWPLAVRIPASRATSRLERELATLSISAGAISPGSISDALPLTASRGEIFACDYPPPDKHGTSLAGRSLVIDSPDTPLATLWQTVLTEHGAQVRLTCSPAWDDSPENVIGVPNAEGQFAARTRYPDPLQPDVVLFDADPHDHRMPTAACQIWPAARLVALVGFRRPDHDAELRTAGCDLILDKLAPLAELLAAVRPEAVSSQ